MEIRHVKDMSEILANQDFAKLSPGLELYYMDRGVDFKDNLRYDITVMPANMLGNEFSKTKGHYHLDQWQEVYTVLEGTAIYLMQKPFDSARGGISDAYFVKTQKGESIIVPPGYGHVTINPSESEELKMSNWVSPECKVDYKPYENLHGACYYYLAGGQWQKNPNYESVPDLREEKPLKSIPENLDFLKQG